MEKKIQEVKVLKHDSCYTYVLKRTSQFNLKNVLMSAEEFILLHDKDKPKQCELEIGDILVYESQIDDTNTLDLARIITEDCKIIWKEVNSNLHFMVYEGDGLVSDVCVEKDIYLGIRLSKLEDVSKKWKRLIPKVN